MLLARSWPMTSALQKRNALHEPIGSAQARLRSARLSCLSVIRCLLTIAVLLAPASMVTAVSCGLNCSTKCEPGSVLQACRDLPASSCLDGGTGYSCTVRTGCHCADMTNSNPEPPGCNVGACAAVTSQAECLRTTGCDWSDACQDSIDCHSFDEDQNGCNANEHQCEWYKNC